MAIRHVSQHGVGFLKAQEDFRARRYNCPAGVLSIGYGHAVKPHEEFPEPLTEIEASDLLLRDLAPIEIYLTAVLPDIPQCQFDALASFAYNVGLGALDGSTLLRRLKAGDIPGAADEFSRWIYASKRVLLGLIARRQAERDIFLGV